MGADPFVEPTTAVIDFGWLRMYGEEQSKSVNVQYALGNLDSMQREAMLQQELAGLSARLSEVLAFLELVVLFDELWVDATAMEAGRLTIPGEFRHVINPVVPSKDTYLKAIKRTRSAQNSLRVSADSSPVLRELTRMLNDPGPGLFWSSEEKAYFDRLRFEDREVEIELGHLQDTMNTAQRAIFYLEFAREMKRIWVPSSNKREWLSTIGNAAQKSLHETFVERIDGAMTDRKIFADLKLVPPPVSTLILQQAIRRRRSLADAALEIRDSNDARDYRRFLGQVDAAMKDRRLLPTAQAKIDELDRKAKAWREQGDAKEGVLTRKREIKLSALVPDWTYPLKLASGAMKATGVGDIRVDDPILTRVPGYLSFISSWYRR